jgi:hypothetical protein
MKKEFIIIMIFVYFLIGSSQVSFAGDLQEGVNRIKAGEYNAGYKLIFPLAEQGNSFFVFWGTEGVSPPYAVKIHLDLLKNLGIC